MHHRLTKKGRICYFLTMQLYIVGGVAPTPYILIKMTQLILDVLKEIEQVPGAHLCMYITSNVDLLYFAKR